MDFLFHRVNDAVSGVLAIQLNALLAYMIVKKTPSELASYGRVLLVMCVNDLALAVATLICMPVGFGPCCSE